MDVYIYSPVPTADTEKRPSRNSRFDSLLRQQKLPAWQPITRPGSVIGVFLGTGLVLLPLGVAMIVAANAVFEQVIDYTDCEDPVCVKTLNLEKTIEGEIFFYYGLSQFYQNLRRYKLSLSARQLLGDLDNIKVESNAYNCDPFKSTNESVIHAPCGAIANSLFNDTFSLEKDGQPVFLTSEGTAWPSFKNKFKNPAGSNLSEVFENYEWPPNWPETQREKFLENGAFENPEFMIWMQPAATPIFRKPWKKLDNRYNSKDFHNRLPKGSYTIRIENNFEVRNFHGKKRLIIGTTSWAGGKRLFLPVLSTLIGIICILFGLLFVGIHRKMGKSLTEIADVDGTKKFSTASALLPL